MFYTASNALTGVSIPLEIKDEGNPVYSNPAVLNFTGSGVFATASGTTVDIYIPGNASAFPFTGSAEITGSIVLTGSMFVSGAISASSGPNTVGFYGTASWAQSASNALFAQTASFITASNVWGPFGSSSVASASFASSSVSASYAETASLAYTASFITASNVWGPFGSSSVASASFASSSVSASYAETASLAYTASFITASNVWGIFGSSSVASASFASSSISASYAETASFVLNPYPINVTGSSLYSVAPVAGVPNIPVANNSIFFGNGAGFGAPLAANSNFLGYQAGYNGAFVSNANFIGYLAGRDATYSNNSNFIGYRAGFHATASTNSNFIGTTAGEEAINAQESNFIGYYAGYQATDAQKSNFIGYTVGRSASNAAYSNFLGYSAGDYAVNASHSILIGSRAGYNNLATANNSVGPNNIILGTNITLPPASKDSINIGGLIFATGSHSDFLAINPLPTPAGGNVGINIYPPLYNFHVSGTVAFPNLTTSSQINVVVIDTASGQLFYTASSAIGEGGSGTPAPPTNSIQFNNDGVFGGSSNFTFDNSSNIATLTGSLQVIYGSNNYYNLLVTESNGRSYVTIGDTQGLNNNTQIVLDDAVGTISARADAGIYLTGLSDNITDSYVITISGDGGKLGITASSAVGSSVAGNPAPPTNSIQFNNGGIFGGSEAFTFISASSTIILTGSLITSGSTQTIGTASFTGSVLITGSTQTIGTASFTGSTLITGSANINGTLFFGTGSAQALYTTAKITTVSGINTIYSLRTASYDGAFFDYTLISGTNARAGQIMSIWSGSEIRHTETTTTDIGSTSEFIFSVALTAGSASLQVTGSTGAIIKTIIKGI